MIALVLATVVRLVPMQEPVVFPLESMGKPEQIETALRIYRLDLGDLSRYPKVPYPSKAGTPGFGYPSRIEPYAVDDELAAKLAEYPGLEAYWFCRERLLAKPEKSSYTESSRDIASLRPYSDSIPFLLFRPKGNVWLCPWTFGRKIPLVIYMPGSGEQGTDLKLQFRQTACLKKVTSAAFQEKHPCWFLIPMPPMNANWNIPQGYPTEPRMPLITLYNDLVLKVIELSERSAAPTIDRSRLYVTGLGSGGTMSAVMAFDHPGRYAAVMPVWSFPHVQPVVHPLAPGAWWYGWQATVWEKKAVGVEVIRRRLNRFAADVRQFGGDFVIRTYPEGRAAYTWWNAVWESDVLWDWCFAKRSKGEVEVVE